MSDKDHMPTECFQIGIIIVGGGMGGWVGSFV